MNYKIQTISDIHGYLIDIPECDLLIIAGDICPVWNHDILYQRKWIDEDFRYWLNNIPAKQVIGIAGNHDFIFERCKHLVPKNLRWIYLEDNSCIWNEYNIYGSPWQTGLNRWAFYCEKPKLIRKRIPTDTDILITHEPPFGFGDEVLGGDHVGCKYLLEEIKQRKVLYNICGHLHESRGIYKINETTIINAACLDRTYTLISPSIGFELCPKIKQKNVVFSQGGVADSSLQVNS